MSIRVLGQRVALVLVEKQSVTDFGIILPEGHEEQKKIGVVAVVGTGALLEDGTLVPVELKIGEKVLFGEFAGVPLSDPVDGREYFIINEIDVLAKFVD